MSESRDAESSTEVSATATEALESATEGFCSTGATDEELTETGGKTASEDELNTTIDELDGSDSDELETAILLEDFPFDFLDAELAVALAEELAGTTTAELAGTTEAELAGTEAVEAFVSSSNSANKSLTWANEC